MKNLLVHNAFFRLLMPPIYGALVYLLILLFNNEISAISEMLRSEEVYVCIGITYLVSESMRILTGVFERYINSIIAYLLLSLTVVLIVTWLGITAYFQWVLGFQITNSQLLQFAIIFGLSSFLYNLLFLSQLYLKKENKARLKEEQYLTESLEKELNQFKNEVNPQLLYDGLETLITIIRKSTEESEDYIDRLSLVYRYILSNKSNELVNINEDLRAAEAIIFLLNPKYANAIKLTNQLPDLTGKMIIPSTLPAMIESIIRNTIINEGAPLEIIILEEDGLLVLEHKLNSVLTDYDHGTLANIQASYSVYTEKPVVQVKAYNHCYTKIPLLEVKEEPLTMN